MDTELAGGGMAPPGIMSPENKRLAVFAINQRDGADRAFWTKVGVAFRNRDGSLNIVLEALPTNGKLHVREANEENRRSRSSDSQFNEGGR